MVIRQKRLLTLRYGDETLGSGVENKEHEEDKVKKNLGSNDEFGLGEHP